MPVECGSVPPHNAHAPAPASPPPAPPAVPPARMTSMATSAACGCDVATIAVWAWTVERPAKWKFLIARAFFQRFGVPRREQAGLEGFLAYYSPAGQWLVCQRPDAGKDRFPLPGLPDKRSRCR